MRAAAPCCWLIGLTILAGCQNGQLAQQPQGFAWQQQPQSQPYVAQMQDLNRRVAQLDANNRDLHMQLAQSQQNAQLAGNEVTQLRKQLTDTATQLRTAMLAKQDAEKKVDAITASTRLRGGATITANNSIKSTLAPINLPGFDVRQDQDVIRIALPADQLFRQGTVQMLPGGQQALDGVADAIARTYPRQRIGIEGHTDTPPSGALPTTSHQLSAAQAYAVFESLATRSRLPASQMFVISQGAQE
jgi:flagellar motor protein MotB